MIKISGKQSLRNHLDSPVLSVLNIVTQGKSSSSLKDYFTVNHSTIQAKWGRILTVQYRQSYSLRGKCRQKQDGVGVITNKKPVEASPQKSSNWSDYARQLSSRSMVL
ncbi:hypothetical protein Bbelb_006380 [Branchiostoma belcheri]|nr:hypothetical protein Bbelb_006380 [Branchiostoma belcheri]